MPNRLEPEIRELMARADKEWSKARFGNVHKILDAIPEEQRSSEVAVRLVKSRSLQRLRSEVLSALQSVDSPRNAEVALARAAAYLAEVTLEGAHDSEVQSLFAGVRDSARAIGDAASLKRQFRTWGAIVGGLSVAGMLILVVVGIVQWGRKGYLQRMALQQATAQGRWDDALLLDPRNIEALLGRAAAKLAASPPDLAGATKDVELAEQQGAVAASTNGVRAILSAETAIDAAERGAIDEAMIQLTLAEKFGARRDVLVRGREKVIAAWLRLGKTVIERRDTTALKRVSSGLEAAGSSLTTIRGLWVSQAQECIRTTDVPGFVEACDEASLRGLPAADVASLWLAFCQAALAADDATALAAALARATEKGADEVALGPLQVGLVTLEAKGCAVAGNQQKAADMMMNAIAMNRDAATNMLNAAGHKQLRDCLVAEYRRRVGEYLEAAQLEDAFKVIETASGFEPSASEWLVRALTLERLRSVPPAVLGQLPPETVAAAVARIPVTEEISLPPVVNSVGIRMRLLHGGSFMMGDQRGESDETPFEVILTRRFYIGVYEVTNAQWKKVMGTIPGKWTDDDSPVEQVDWAGAAEFCRRLSALPEEQAMGRTYRLPTEAEWEYACRAGTSTRRSFGDDRSQLAEFAWFDANSGGSTHPVGQKLPNQWGLHDMCGNVWEWCSDYYGEYPTSAVTNPQGPTVGSNRVSRGGGWSSAATRCRSSSRDSQDPSHRRNNLGFRIAGDFLPEPRQEQGR